MEKIRLADGTEYFISWLGHMITLSASLQTDKSIADIALEFSDPALTGSITHLYGGNHEETFEGYTNLTLVQKTPYGTTIILERSTT